MLWLGGWAIAIACSVTAPTPKGTVVASFQASQSKWPDLAAAVPKAISGHFSDGPMHFAGMPDDQRALDFTAQLSQGTRSCKGTSYTNDWLRLRIHGDGRAELRPDPVAVGSVAPPVLSR